VDEGPKRVSSGRFAVGKASVLEDAFFLRLREIGTACFAIFFFA